jgi:hypothetical protein
LAKPNYSFEKRQKEIAKKKKQEEKRPAQSFGKSGTPAPEDGTLTAVWRRNPLARLNWRSLHADMGRCRCLSECHQGDSVPRRRAGAR